MNIFVTGASGFLGTSLCKKLESGGNSLEKPCSKTCDLTKQDSLKKFDGIKYDKIIHLAAWTQAGDFCLHHPGEQWVINQQINTNILSWWHDKQPQAKLLFMGTSCSYDPSMEHAEENYLAGVPIDSLFTYAMTKRMLYAGALALTKQFGLKFNCFVPSTLYGPGYHTDGRQMHFIFDLIRKIIRGKLYGETVTLWGDGYQKRELVYIDDFIRIMLELDEKYDNELVNIGADGEFTIRDFAKAICEKVDYDFEKIEFDTSKYVGAKSKILIVKKIKGMLPDYSLISLDEGLSKTIDWFMENRDKLVSPVG